MMSGLCSSAALPRYFVMDTEDATTSVKSNDDRGQGIVIYPPWSNVDVDDQEEESFEYN